MNQTALGASDQGLWKSLRADLSAAQARLREEFERSGDAEALIHGRTRNVDALLHRIWTTLDIPADLALVAVGGYGRGELFPASDVDILVLVPDGFDVSAEPRVEQLIGGLWDVGLEIGHSVRTVAECVSWATGDITVQTTLLEARFLEGGRRLFEQLERRMLEVLDPLKFFKAKRLEQEERYARFNETPYSLEPNCKESPGGFRDLQVILWVARAARFGTCWRGLAERDLLTSEELRHVRQAENFLRLVRIRLHHIARRREERLLFDHQEKLAQAFKLQATAGKRASEVLMQRYFRNARFITQLNTILLQNIGARLFPSQHHVPIVIDQHFQMVRELLDIRSENLFEEHPAAILRSFLMLERRSELKGMTARTLRALWRARHRIDAAFRRDQGNRSLFLQLFQQKRGLVHEMRRMNQYDILGHYLPAFGRIVGQMQHDLFHVYTVDQHILQVMRNLRRFTMAEFAHEYPYCTRLITGFERQWLLYIAALFHDIAKGRGGDHSRLGMVDAADFCRDHGIEGEDADLISFLVEHHLTMSSVAQKQDLADHNVIEGFAKAVGTPRRLTALYLLTVADIRGTSPKVWNAWKGKLLEDLYHITLRHLRGDASPAQGGLAERQDDARRLLRYHGLRGGIEEPLWRQLDTVYFLRHDADEIGWHTRTLYYRPDADAPVVKARVTAAAEGLQVMVYTRDAKDLFARVCGFFARLGYSIAEAKVHTTRHGYALDSFILLDPANQLSNRDMIALIEHDLSERLRTLPPLEPPVVARLSRQVRHFPITPEVAIRPDERGQHYLLTVIAADRPGLLHGIALVLARHGVSVQTAKIATLGERVEDNFLISGRELGQTVTLVRLEQELLEALQT